LEFLEGGRGIVCGPFLENPEGRGVISKIPAVGGVWIFSGTTHCTALAHNRPEKC